MKFRALVLASALAGIVLSTQAQTDPSSVHRSVLVFDPHVDIRSPYDWQHDGRIEPPAYRGDQVSADKLVAGGYDAIGLAIFVPQTERNETTYRNARLEADAKFDYLESLVASEPDIFVLAASAEDIRRAEQVGKIALLPTLLNAFPLGRSADNIYHFHGRGTRILGFTHAGHNDFADSDRPQPRDQAVEHGGLSAEGKKLVRKANELGIVLDVSQLSHDAFRQVLELSRTPVVASHSGIYALSPSPRSLTDDELDLIRDNGGVAGIVAFSSYLVATPPEVSEQIAAIRKRYGAVNGYEGLSIEQREALGAETRALQVRASVSDYVNAIDYAVQRIGIDHVAISSDFNHGGGLVGWEDAAGAEAVTAELLARGYSREDIAKLWGGNVLRVLEAAERYAKGDNPA